MLKSQVLELFSELNSPYLQNVGFHKKEKMEQKRRGSMFHVIYFSLYICCRHLLFTSGASLCHSFFKASVSLLHWFLDMYEHFLKCSWFTHITWCTLYQLTSLYLHNTASRGTHCFYLWRHIYK